MATKIALLFYLELALLAAALFESEATAAELDPGSREYYDQSGKLIPNELLRFTEGSWQRGLDQGFAVALKKETSEYFLWRVRADNGPIGSKPSCQGKLTSADGAPVAIDNIQDFEIGDLRGRGSRYLVALTDHGTGLIAWDLQDCEKAGNMKAAGAILVKNVGSSQPLDRLQVGDFSGSGADEILAIDSAGGNYCQWSFQTDGAFKLTHSGLIPLAPGAGESVRNISYAVMTRLPHEQPNVAYEGATILLHDKGFSIFRNGETIEYVPDCRHRPKMCENKTLLFHLDQGFNGGLQDLAHADPQVAEQIIDRIAEFLGRASKTYDIWALINPIYEDRTATLAVLDRLAKNNIPFILDFYSSDVVTIAYLKTNFVDYKANAYDALKGISLAMHGSTDDPGNLDFYVHRYGKFFAGVRIMERLGLELTVTVPRSTQYIPNEELAKKAFTFDWNLVNTLSEWSLLNNKYIIWSDPAFYIPYECYWSVDQVNAAIADRNNYVKRERELAIKYPTIIPVYDNNEGLKRCGVANEYNAVTPRNFRLSHWQNFPVRIASEKHGHTPLTGPNGFGLSVQSWTTDYDPILNAGTLAGEEIEIWSLDAFQEEAALLELEPYFYFFAWPSNSKILQTKPLPKNPIAGSPQETAKTLFSALAVVE